MNNDLQQFADFIQENYAIVNSEREEDKDVTSNLELSDLLPKYDPKFGDEEVCKCGHLYYRHFDTYENMKAIGCKYCDCDRFESAFNYAKLNDEDDDDDLLFLNDEYNYN